MAIPSNGAKERAELNFKKKEVQAREASSAMAEYQAGLRAEREKTARLRSLREAKKAADAMAEVAPLPSAAGAKAATKTKATTPRRKASSAT